MFWYSFLTTCSRHWWILSFEKNSYLVMWHRFQFIKINSIFWFNPFQCLCNSSTKILKLFICVSNNIPSRYTFLFAYESFSILNLPSLDPHLMKYLNTSLIGLILFLFYSAIHLSVCVMIIVFDKVVLRLSNIFLALKVTLQHLDRNQH